MADRFGEALAGGAGGAGGDGGADATGRYAGSFARNAGPVRVGIHCHDHS
jgi:hypothetical protein